MLMSRINCLTSRGVLGRPPRGCDLHRQYKRKPARCQRITVSGLTIAKALSTPGAKPYSPANTRRSIIAKSRLFRRPAPQDIELVAKRQDLDFKRSSRSEQSDQPAPDQPAELDHRAEASPDSLLFASRIKFATGTAVSAWSECDLGTNFDDAAGRNFEVVTRIVGYARKRDEQPILPARHARAGGRLERPAGQEERS